MHGERITPAVRRRPAPPPSLLGQLPRTRLALARAGIGDPSNLEDRNPPKTLALQEDLVVPLAEAHYPVCSMMKPLPMGFMATLTS